MSLNPEHEREGTQNEGDVHVDVDTPSIADSRREDLAEENDRLRKQMRSMRAELDALKTVKHSDPRASSSVLGSPPPPTSSLLAASMRRTASTTPQSPNDGDEPGLSARLTRAVRNIRAVNNGPPYESIAAGNAYPDDESHLGLRERHTDDFVENQKGEVEISPNQRPKVHKAKNSDPSLPDTELVGSGSDSFGDDFDEEELFTDEGFSGVDNADAAGRVMRLAPENGVDYLPFRNVLADRAGWLVGLLVLQSCSSFIIARNEALLESHLVIVQFLTMLVGAGGNAGNQAAVRVIRGLAVGTLNGRTYRAFLWTETKMAFCLSAILGLTGCIRAAVFQVPVAETIAITSSLCIIVSTSVFIGSLLPMGMKRCGIDPAHSSTTIQVLMDILGVTCTVLVSGAILNTGAGNTITSWFSLNPK